MRKHRVLLYTAVFILSGCRGGSTASSNGLTVTLSSSNAAKAAELSMTAPSAVMSFMEGFSSDIPTDVVTDIEARTTARQAGIAARMSASREEEACDGGGKIITDQTDTQFILTFENCTESENIAATDNTPAYSSTNITNGTITFADSTVDGYPEAEMVSFNLTDSSTTSDGEEEAITEQGSFITGYSDTGYIIKNMNMSISNRGRTSTGTNYNYSIATQDFSITVDGQAGTQTLMGKVTSHGTDESGEAMLEGTFMVETTSPVDFDQTMGEYKITGANASTVITRLDPAGIYVEINGESPTFYAWDDTDAYFSGQTLP
ncbi:MAG: hypothetical protein PHE17_00575 [Thiothrix sp.]|uniref:hypothetical protein n=1 Tax=Thiothrix sp. TaxID=1032 RepID=UPI0026153943|nr:hypothetical protein [Thiothrix sp.]MDD5391487.1 hypothetical protein [Thiothrix sp.]